MPPPAEDTAIDFGGLANRVPRAIGYAEVDGPSGAVAGYERANFELQKPIRPYIPPLRAPGTVPPFLP